jgi:DNA-binding MarR family transcriptional regulator
MKNEFCSSTSFLIHEVVSFMDNQAQKILQTKLDISYFQFLILCMVDSNPEATQKDLSVMLKYTEAAVSKQVEILRKSGFLDIQVDKNNRRQHILSLTDLGTQIVQKAYKLLNDAGSLFFQTLEKAEQTVFNKSLSKLSKFIQSYPN